MDDLWSFLLDEKNRTVLGFLGGGVVVLAGGAWAIVKHRAQRKQAGADAAAPGIEGSVVAGRDIRDSKIRIDSRRN